MNAETKVNSDGTREYTLKARLLALEDATKLQQMKIDHLKEYIKVLENKDKAHQEEAEETFQKLHDKMSDDIAKYCESCAPSFDQQQKVYEQLYADIWEQNKLIAELQKKNAELEETIAHYEEQI